MMKRYFNTILDIVLPVTLLFCSCSKEFTEKSPNDSVPIENALNTEADMQAALNGLYASIRSTALFGNAILVTGDLLADNSFVETDNTGRYVTSYQYSFVAEDAEIGMVWQGTYKSILNANFIINAKLATPGAQQIKSQALAIRALLYFKLVNFYARPYADNPDAMGVPLVLTYDPYSQPGRSTVKEVYLQMLNDLRTASASAPDFTSSITVSKWAIEALLAKVYFYMGDYTNAKNTAARIISASGFTLVQPAGFAGYWANPAAQTVEVETLFEIDANEQTNNGYESVAYLYTGYLDIYASAQLYNIYSNTDLRRTLLKAGSTKSGAPAYIIEKFPNAVNSDPDNLKVIRLAELYLIAAEASLPGNETDARMYLNQVATLRDPAFTGYPTAVTGKALLDAIVEERRKELAFEGDRFYDLNRLKRDITRSQNAGAIAAGTANANLTVPYSRSRRVLPIPQAEILSNSVIARQQNPGY